MKSIAVETTREVPENPENKSKVKGKIINVAELIHTHEMMLEQAETIDYNLLGAKPKIKKKLPVVKSDDKPVEPEKKTEISRGKSNYFDRLVNIDKMSCQFDKKSNKKSDKTSEDKIKDKIEVRSCGSGYESVVKTCQDNKIDLKEVEKLPEVGLKKFKLDEVKSTDLEIETAKNLSPMRKKIKAGNVAFLKDKFDKMLI